MAREFIQSDIGDQWTATSSSNKEGWENYIPNAYTTWAVDHGIDLKFERIRKKVTKRTRSVFLHGKAVKDIYTYKKRYVRDKYTEWYEKRALPSTYWTIMEYKSYFKRNRPDYSKTFSEKNDNNIKVKYKKAFIVPESLRTMDNWFIERERLPKEKNQKRTIVAERILDASGKIRRVSLLFFGMDVMFRQEDKTTKHEWFVTVRKEVNINTGPQQMINLKVPWFVYIRSVG